MRDETTAIVKAWWQIVTAYWLSPEISVAHLNSVIHLPQNGILTLLNTLTLRQCYPQAPGKGKLGNLLI